MFTVLLEQLRRSALAACATAVAAACLANALPAAAKEREYVPDTLLIKFSGNASDLKRGELRKLVRALRSDRVSPHSRDIEKIRLPRGMTVETALKLLAQQPGVEIVEPDWKIRALPNSNDPLYTNGSLWGMYGDSTTPANAFGSGAGEVWAAGSTGSSDVYVGVIDEGLDPNHPDLAANVWVNPYDPVDGVDNDGNGYIDDVNGWDFDANDNSVFDGGTGDTHGTHVAGTIGAVGGNGAGVAGVNWSVKMISAKFLGATGGTTSGAIAALLYINDLKRRHGIDIVATSNSWGGGGFSQQLLNAINEGGDLGILFIAAAGNDGVNVDTSPDFPASHTCTTANRSWDCVISVAAIGSTGALATFSNYGASLVDIGAPGVSIQSTLPNNTYGAYSGTSMATPHVSGAAALCASVDPLMRGKALRDVILATAVPTTSLNGRTVTGGRLDASAMHARCLPPTAPLVGGPDQLTAGATTQQTIDLSWLDSAQNESGFEVQRSAGACSATSTFSTIAQLDAGATAYRDTNLADGATFCYRVRATSRYLVDGAPMASDWTLPVQATALPPPPPYVCNPQAYTWVTMTGGSVLSLGDDASASVTLPFAFPFYGVNMTSVLVSSNGFIQFTSGPANEYQNTALPNAAAPNGIIAAFWDDLNPSSLSGSGQVRVRTIGTTPGNRQFAIAWEGVRHFDVAGNPITAQIVLDEASGRITLNYQDVLVGSAAIDLGASATVGIENRVGSSATQIGFNQAALSNLSTRECVIDLQTPPAVPVGVAAAASSPTAINVSWTDVAGETGYTVERVGSTGTTEVALGAGVTRYSHTGVAAGSTWTYRVRASNTNGLSAWSSTATATTPNPPTTTPANVQAAVVSGTLIRVTWGNVANETGFEIERLGPTGTPAPNPSLATVGANVLRHDHTVTRGQTWQYRVRAFNTGGASAWSPVVTATTPTLPLAPANVSLTPSVPTATITWTDNANNETRFDIGRATRRANGTYSAIAVVGTATTVAGTGATGTFTHTPGVGTYRYSVRAVNLAGASAWVTAGQLYTQ